LQLPRQSGEELSRVDNQELREITIEQLVIEEDLDWRIYPKASGSI
jgi:hypothetical protein